MVRHTVAQLLGQIRELREQRDGPDAEEVLSIWKLLGAMVSMLEAIVLTSPALANHEHVNYVLHELVDMHKDMVGNTPGIDDDGDADNEPPAKRRRLDSAGGGNAGVPGPSTGSRASLNTSPHRLDGDVVINDNDDAGSSGGPSTGQTETRESNPGLFAPPGFDSDDDQDKLL